MNLWTFENPSLYGMDFFELFMENRSVAVIGLSGKAMQFVLNTGTEESGFMENNKTVVRRCPYCGSPFELVLS